MSTAARARAAVAGATALVSLLAACSADEGQGTLRVTIYGEDFVEDRIPAAEVDDGWEITFSRFLVAVDGIVADGTAVPGTYVFDLVRPSDGAGHFVDALPMPAGTVDHLDYRVGPAHSEATGNAPADAVAAMASAGDSLWVVGSAIRGGMSLNFEWRFSTDTRYVECDTAQRLPDGGEATSQITVHADHLFYDDLESEAPNVAFDLIASADVDGDQKITADELRAVDITGEARYQVGSRAVFDLWSFVEAQTETLGHIDGEGHCDVAL